METFLTEEQIKTKVEFFSSAKCNHTYHKYIDITGDLVAGTLLSQILYWFSEDKNKKQRTRIFKDGHYWIAKNRSEWWDEIRITERQYDKAIKLLCEKGFVVLAKYKFNAMPTIHIRVDYKAINKAVDEWKDEIREEVLRDAEADFELHKVENGNYTKCNTGVTESVSPLTMTNNNDYSTETTKDLRSVNDLSLQENTGNIYTPDSANPGEQSADLPDETGIETVVSEVVDDLGIEQSETKDISEDINTLITTFNTLSTDKPRNLTKTGLSKITYGYLMPPENMDDAGVDDYVAMLKEYFKTDFGARGRYKGKITRSLEHFMSDGIRSRLYERCRQNE